MKKNSSSSKDERSEEASSNKEWTKRKKLEEETINWQKFQDRLERMELSINANLYESHLEFLKTIKYQTQQLKKIRKVIKAVDVFIPSLPPSTASH